MKVTTLKVAVVAACGAMAMTLVGCDLGEPPRTYPGLAVVGIGDANGDGHLDLVTISDPDAEDGLVVRLGDGTGNFPSSLHVPAESGHCTPNLDCSSFDRIMVDDFTGDGVIDFVQQVWKSFPDMPGIAALELRANDGRGRFGQPVLITTDEADFHGNFGDVTADGLPDMVTFDGSPWDGTSQILVRPSDGAGGFGPEIASEYRRAPGANIDFGDFDSDGHIDLLLFGECFTNDTGDETRACVEVRRGDSSGVFPAGATVLAADPEATDIHFPVITHLDDDEHLDVVGNWAHEPMSAFYGDGQGGLTPGTVPTPAGTVDVAAGDFDSDGYTDLLFTTDNRNADRHDDWSRITFGDGTRHFGPSRVIGGHRAQIADLDADGRPDYVASAWSCDCRYPDRIEVYMNRWQGRPG